MEDAEQTQKWNKEDQIDALSRSTDKPRIEYCEDQNGRTVYIFVQDKATVTVFSQSNLVFL